MTTFFPTLKTNALYFCIVFCLPIRGHCKLCVFESSTSDMVWWIVSSNHGSKAGTAATMFEEAVSTYCTLCEHCIWVYFENDIQKSHANHLISHSYYSSFYIIISHYFHPVRQYTSARSNYSRILLKSAKNSWYKWGQHVTNYRTA